MPPEREETSAIESCVVEGDTARTVDDLRDGPPAAHVGSSSPPVGKPIMIPDLNKKTMTKVSVDGAREEGPLKAGADGFAVCDLPSGTVSTEIPNLALATFVKPPRERGRVLKKPAARKRRKRNSKDGGKLYFSEDESEGGGGTSTESADDASEASDVVPGAGGEAASSSARPPAAAATPAVIAAAGDADAPDPDNLAYAQMFYKKGKGSVGIRKRGKTGDGKPHKQLFQFSDASGKLEKDALLEIGTACRRKLENGESTENVRAWVTEQVRAKAAAVET